MINKLELTEEVRKWIDVSTTRSMRDGMRFIRSAGLSMPQFTILMHLHYAKGNGLNYISDLLQVSPAAASQLVEKLVVNGLLERSENPNDRREKIINLSPKALNLIEEGINVRTLWVEELINNLNQDEYETVAAAFNTLSRATRRIDNNLSTKNHHHSFKEQK